MHERQALLARLGELSRSLGAGDRDFVVLAEGNTSTRVDGETFFVKASGAQLGRAVPESFVAVRFAPILAMLDGPDRDDAAVKAGIQAACVKSDAGRPSIETFLHALALTTGGARWVGHTHPTAVNAVLCSAQPQALVDGHVFPDAIVVYGPHPLYVPYLDPGLPLARAMRHALVAHIDRHGEPPKAVFLQNHGMIALGQTPEEVENITIMAVKSARVLVGTYALGGPRYMEPEHVARIHNRPDELIRRNKLGGKDR
jgi:rhamnose utilization protein RhaD (predicted bifunctional aldolase and dehydrogenase)